MTVEVFSGKIKKLMTFSGGEPHVTLEANRLYFPENPVWILAHVRSFNDLGEVLVLTDALRRYGYERICLDIPYFPGARQDRYQECEALTVKVYADIINAQKYYAVRILDPHSDVAPALINNCQVIGQNWGSEKAVELMSAKTDLLCVVAPDAGAMKKAGKLACSAVQVAVATKTRDTATGQLGNPVIHADSLPEDVLVVDDICDGGGTFIQLAPVLRAKGAKRLCLYVSHGIFSKGIDVVLEHYDHIYTTNSFYQGPSTDRVTVFEL